MWNSSLIMLSYALTNKTSCSDRSTCCLAGGLELWTHLLTYLQYLKRGRSVKMHNSNLHENKWWLSWNLIFIAKNLWHECSPSIKKCCTFVKFGHWLYWTQILNISGNMLTRTNAAEGWFTCDLDHIYLMKVANTLPIKKRSMFMSVWMFQ